MNFRWVLIKSCPPTIYWLATQAPPIPTAVSTPPQKCKLIKVFQRPAKRRNKKVMMSGKRPKALLVRIARPMDAPQSQKNFGFLRRASTKAVIESVTKKARVTSSMECRAYLKKG